MKISRQLLIIAGLIIFVWLLTFFVKQKSAPVVLAPVYDQTISDRGKIIDYQSDLSPGSRIYEADVSQSRVQWSGRNISGQEYYGTVGLLTGVLVVNQENILEKGQLVIDLDDLVVENIADWETNQKLVQHLKSEDFFLVEKFPVATLVLTSLVPDVTIADNWLVRGDLKILTTVQTITFPAQIKVGADTLTAQAELAINRTDWGIIYGSGGFYDNLGDRLIADEIEFKVNIVAQPRKDY